MSIPVARLLSELRGGVVLWQGQPWWFVLPKSLRIAQPEPFAEWLLRPGEQPPALVATWMGGTRCFALDSLCLAQWKMELLKAGLATELLPSPSALLTEGRRLPWEIHGQDSELVERLWARLAPLLGSEKATRVFEFLHLGWARGPKVAYQKDAFARFSKLIRSDPALRHNWSEGSHEERAELFAAWMGPGRCNLETLAQFGWGDWHDALDVMRAVWCEPELSLDLCLALGLVFPGACAPKTLSADKVNELLAVAATTPELTYARWQTMIDTIEATDAPADLLARTELRADDLVFAGQHGLTHLLGQRQGTRRERRFLRLCRRLLKAGFQSRWLDKVALIARAGRGEAFVYLLLADLEQAPNPAQLEVFQELAPAGRFQEAQPDLPSLPPELLPEVGELSRLFDLSPSGLTRCLQMRRLLRLPPFPKRLQSWSPSRLRAEEEHLRQALQTRPHDAVLQKRYTALASRTPDDRERKNVGEELARSLDELPKQLWEDARPAILQRLLSALLGEQVAASAPRAGFLLRHPDISIARLTSLRHDHPENEAWLRSFERAGYCAARWLDEWSADLWIEGKYVELVAESDPAEIMEMGSHFRTCLSIDTGENAFSVLTNILEVNKRVLIGRDVEGRVVIRKLIGVNLKGQMVGYHTYSHWGSAKGAVHAACRDLADYHGFKLSNTAVPERVFKDLDWYDDGAEVWIGQSLPDSLPAGWARDPEALDQWRARNLERAGSLEGPGFYRRQEVFQTLFAGRPLPQDVVEHAWWWDEVVAQLGLARRYDLLAGPTLALRDSLCGVLGSCGMDKDEAALYAGLLDPGHRLYRRLPDRGAQHAMFIDPSPCLVLLSPGELRKICQRLARAGWLHSGSLFSRRMADILAWAHLLNPSHGAWRRFDGGLLAELMVEVACRQPMHCWRAPLGNLTAARPAWGAAWYARALVEGGKLRTTLEDKLREYPEDLSLALAVVDTGGNPEAYRLPTGKDLLQPEYLQEARPLASRIARRLERAGTKGFTPAERGRARKALKSRPHEGWPSWPDNYRDDALDRQLSQRFLAQGDHTVAGAWVALAKAHDRPARAHLLRLLGVSLNAEACERVLHISAWELGSPRDQLVSLWLGQPLIPEGWPSGSLHLAYARWPELVRNGLLPLELPDRLQALSSGAELATPQQLAQLMAEVLGDSPIGAELAIPYLLHSEVSVEFQLGLLARLQPGQDLGALSKTERGRWALERFGGGGSAS